MTPISPAHPPITLKRVPCPLCDHTASTRLLVVPDWCLGVTGDAEFAIERCDQCGHAFMNPAPTPESIPLCYPDGYPEHKADQSGTEPLAPPSPASSAGTVDAPPTTAVSAPSSRTPWYLSPSVRRIPGLRGLYYWLTDPQSQPVPPGAGRGQRALEIGCGSGRFLVALREAGWEAQGLDLVPAAVEVSREKGFAVHCGDLDTFSCPPESFDGIFAWQVLEHLPRPRETLQLLRSLLKPNGCVGFGVPNYGGLECRLFGRYWSVHELPRHLQHFTPQVLQRLLTETGFTDIKIHYQPSLRNWLGSVGYWLRDRFPRSSWGPRLVDWYFLNPPLMVTLLMAPVARLLSFFRLTGRLTIIARRAD